MYPYLRIDLARIRANACALVRRYADQGMQLTGVTKGVHGNLEIAQAMLDAGVQVLADSRVKNLSRMRKYSQRAQFVLLRSPMPCEVNQVVRFADVSLNTETAVVELLSSAAVRVGKQHSILICVEVGDGRDGVMPDDLGSWVEKVAELPGVRIAGLAANFGCFIGVRPTQRRLDKLRKSACLVAEKLERKLDVVSVGNSVFCRREMERLDFSGINNIRLGESILLGSDGLDHTRVMGLDQDTFLLSAQIIEIKKKHRRGATDAEWQAIAAIGKADCRVESLEPLDPVTVLGSTSDHCMLVSPRPALDLGFAIGSEVRFRLGYDALHSAMSSNYISKRFV